MGGDAEIWVVQVDLLRRGEIRIGWPAAALLDAVKEAGVSSSGPQTT